MFGNTLIMTSHDVKDIVQSRLPAEVKRWIEEHVDDAIDTSIDNDKSISVALRWEEYVEDTEKYLSMYKGDVENLDQLLIDITYPSILKIPIAVKAKQSSRFVGISTLPPKRKHHSSSKRPRSSSPGEGTSDNKRKRVQFSDTELDTFFFLSMETKLKESIRTVVSKNNKKMNEQLAALKQKLSTAKKLPSGIITGAAKLAESTYNEPSQADLILQQMRSFMDNRVGKKNEIEWQEFVVKKFDTSKNEEANLAKSAQLESNDTDRDSVPDADCPAVDENSYRICTASINKLIREDLDPSIKDLIMKKLQRAMIGSTEYILHFSSLIQIMMICLKTNQFFLDGDVINT
ncbi:hypothetical protein G6F45_002094 [Rhizopus arrhizus]|nr:hypothetical protein G6F52_004797 [Rhizopus delemar]KAG1635337.1 hypothetical protein G6F45_002094 [Rhizopus arrhizus]